MVSQIKDFSDVDNVCNYQGYYWLSDKSKPTVFAQSESLNLATLIQDHHLPFIIEGNFCCIENGIEKFSVSIRHINGQYQITKYDFTNIPNLKEFLQAYKGHDIGEYDFLMVEYWEIIADELLAGMKTLQPAWSAFYGFKSK